MIYTYYIVSFNYADRIILSIVAYLEWNKTMESKLYYYFIYLILLKSKSYSYFFLLKINRNLNDSKMYQVLYE